MRCPFCGFAEQRVLDSRPSTDADAVRRRRECMGCGRRFTTFERAERPRLFVVKKDRMREEFDREKLLNSMLIACRKRRIPIEDLREAVARIERDLFIEADEEVPTQAIGERVMRELRRIDPVAYVRFASVYRDFESTEDFHRLVEDLECASLAISGPITTHR
ncbi:MAG: transcriptional regulator NrdR [Fimbriimonadaceae bacterium]|jgi:transcriptional repressor NrdR|nr:transcriptional regulator NrdR [Fimbriimonadaceae bacterium]